MSRSTPRFFTTSILPVSERLVLKGGRSNKISLRVRVGYFYDERLGHTLIDTGYFNARLLGQLRPSTFLSLYRALLRPTTLTDEPLASGLVRLGVAKKDIQTILITHFHADHIGALRDFPAARILCAQESWASYRGHSRLKNALSGVFEVLVPQNIEERLGFFEDSPLVTAPEGLGEGRDILGDGSLLAIDLPGHAAGHTGLCFPRLPTPFLYATDTQWLMRAILEDRAPGFPASLVGDDRAATRSSVQRVAAFARGDGDVLLCHDPAYHPYDLVDDFDTEPELRS